MSTQQHQAGGSGARIISVVASLLSIGAGVYMVLNRTQAGNSVFNVLMHGIGVYFIARGLQMAADLQVTADIREALYTLTGGKPAKPNRRLEGGAAKPYKPPDLV